MKIGLFWTLIFSLLLVSCERKPKVISSNIETATPQSNTPSTGIFSDNKVSSSSTSSPDVEGLHTVVVIESLPTEKYIYINVEEGDQNYWIAALKQDIKVGAKYSFNNGLLKTNFESKEYNRTFDKIYLVSNLTPLEHIHNEHSENTNSQQQPNIQRQPKEGSVSIATIVNDPQKFEGQQVQVSGECTKLNANIMGRNWIHLKDGSNDDYDFVVTSDIAIPEGHFVTLSGTLSLNRDFGAGYRYEIIIEDAEVVK